MKVLGGALCALGVLGLLLRWGLDSLSRSPFDFETTVLLERASIPAGAALLIAGILILWQSGRMGSGSR